MSTPLIKALKEHIKEREVEELEVDVMQNIEDLYETLERVHYYLCDLEVLLQKRVFGKDPDAEEASENSPSELIRKKFWRPNVS